MLTAKVGDSIINCIDGKYDRYRLKQWSNKGILKCPVCDDDYEYCHGEIVSPYFRHKGKECEGYYGEPETEEHRKGKEILFNWIKNQDGVENCKLEAWIPETKQRPDIYFEYNNKRYVIEFQCTPIASEYLIRKELYKLAGINDIWVLGTEKYNIKVNDLNDIVHSQYYKNIEKDKLMYLNVKSKEVYLDNAFIERKLTHHSINLKNYYLYNLNEFKFDNGGIRLNDDIIIEFIVRDKEKFKLLQNVKKFKNNSSQILDDIINKLNEEFNTDTFYFDNYFSFYYLSKIYYKSLTFFIHEETVDVGRPYLKSVPFRGKRGGIGWKKKTFYEQLTSFNIDISEPNTIFECIKEYIRKRENEKMKKLEEKNKQIREKYYPIFKEFLDKEIILILQHKQKIPDNIRFKFLKKFNTSEEYMTVQLLKELEFLSKKGLNVFTLMIPKYDSYFNNYGLSRYVKVGEIENTLIDIFKSYGFTNVKFLEESEVIS